MKHAKEQEISRGKLFVLGVAILAIGVGATAFSAGRSTSDQSSRAEPRSTSTERPTEVDKKDPYSQYRVADWIVTENAKPGTTDWKIPDDRVMWSKIEGFFDTTSIDVGGSAVLKSSTRATSWLVSAYRIGWYGGSGARLIWKSDPQPGINQPKPTQVAPTKTWSAPWTPSLTITTDETWPPGQYLFKLESVDGGAQFVPLVIRDDKSQSDLLMQSAVTTWQAYNGWGGASLYTGVTGRADAVSFDRPYTGNGSGEFLGREREFISFVERNGFDVSYWTNIDLHERGELAKNHRGIIIPGHDEYYTVEMRKNLEAAREAGVNIGFFGANNVYRRIRLESASSGQSRVEVNYRDASRDPLNGKDPERVTTSFREGPAANPESSLTGSYYECNPVEADWVVGDASAWMFKDSGFKNGDKVAKMVGNEYDRVTPSVITPGNIQVIAHSPVTCKGKSSFADTTWYSAQSGAGVFTAATFGWSPRLLDACPAGPPTTPICKLQKVTDTILRAFSAGPAGAAHPSVSNLSTFGIASPRTTTPPMTLPGSTPSSSSTTTAGR
ncbi:MAG: N,N-dimethylformamidase beta subunit family domain-containing protein [Acidimicrobiales bacterium]